VSACHRNWDGSLSVSSAARVPLRDRFQLSSKRWVGKQRGGMKMRETSAGAASSTLTDKPEEDGEAEVDAHFVGGRWKRVLPISTPASLLAAVQKRRKSHHRRESYFNRSALEFSPDIERSNGRAVHGMVDGGREGNQRARSLTARPGAAGSPGKSGRELRNLPNRHVR
jgi:hypothetical protein